MTPPIIYNLFPRLVGPIPRWDEHVERARAMVFNWIYLNPWHYPGFSGSLYAPKEFGRLNPLFLPTAADEYTLDPLREFLQRSRLPVIMDLVVNHTSKDSPLTVEHPSWFKVDERGELISPFAVDPDDPSNVTVWGDLAEVDNAGSPDRAALWDYWAGLVVDALELGFAGFRCDAAYMVPADLWRHLIDAARRVRPEVRFFAETLGASEEAVHALRHAGFDYFFNSSKWWNFRDEWALEQHATFGRIAPSISFPESHDTTRLAEDTRGDEAIQRQRYAFAAGFSAGLMMPIGYEFGFRRRLDVVTTMPSDWERRTFDLRSFIRRVNLLKSSHPHLRTEGSLARRPSEGEALLLLERRVEGHPSPGFLAVNTDTRHLRTLDVSGVVDDTHRLRLHRVCRDDEPDPTSVTPRVELHRGEVVYLLPDSGDPS